MKGSSTSERGISLSLLSRTKMVLHSAQHGFSNPIHGILLGHRHPRGSQRHVALQVTDVLPVCHEVPTKPIVDMALQLATIYLKQRQEDQKEKEELPKSPLQIVGWYTANANVTVNLSMSMSATEATATTTTTTANVNNSNQQLPNASACRIASAIAQHLRTHNHDNSDNSDCDHLILLLLNPLGLLPLLSKAKSNHGEAQVGETSELPIVPSFTAFEEDDKCKTFTRRVDPDRLLPSASGTTLDNDETFLHLSENEIQKKEKHFAVVITQALRSMTKVSSSIDQGNNGVGGQRKELVIYDFVDHLTDFEKKEDLDERDWIENNVVNEFVANCLKT